MTDTVATLNTKMIATLVYAYDEDRLIDACARARRVL